MTISTTSSQAVFLGNGATLTFSYNFVCDDPATFELYFNAADGTITLQDPSTYTLFLNPIVGSSLHHVGGNVTYPNGGPPIANGTSITIKRTVPLAQLDSISNQGDFYAQVTELALDTLCLETQQVAARTGQIRGTWQTGIVYNFGDIVQDGVNGANTGNYYMCAIANTSGVWATDLANGDWSLGINVAAISGDAAAAQAAAAAALVSETAAAASAAAAGGSAASASTSATNASNSAVSSAASAAAAAVSQSAAASSETAAAASATSAATSATNSANSATSSANSATSAAASAASIPSGLSATSTTSVTIGVGSKTFSIAAGKIFSVNELLIIGSNADPTNNMIGYVTSYVGTNLIMNIILTNGLGTYSDWNISITGAPSGIFAGIDGGFAPSIQSQLVDGGPA